MCYKRQQKLTIFKKIAKEIAALFGNTYDYNICINSCLYNLYHLQEFASRVMGKFSIVVPLFVAMSCFGSMNGCIFAISR